MMNVEPQDGRVVRAASRWTCTPVLAAVVRVLALVGLAVGAWFLTSVSAHADTGTSPVSGTASPTQIAVGERVPGSADTAEDGTDDPYGVASAMFLDAWWLEFIAPAIGDTEGAAVPVTRASAPTGLPVTPVTGSTPLYDVVDRTVLSVPGTLAGPAGGTTLAGPAGSSTLAGLSGGFTGRSLENVVFAPLQRSELVTPLTEAVAPMAAAVTPVLSGTAVLPWFGGTSLVPSTPDAVRLPWNRTLPASAVFLPATATAPSGTASADTASTLPVEPTSAATLPDRDPRASVRSATAPAVPVQPQPGPGSFPAVPGLGTSSGGASGTSTLTHDSGTGAVPAGLRPGTLRVSRVSPVTARTVLPHERAEDPAVSPD